jgi:hypothetical protein
MQSASDSSIPEACNGKWVKLTETEVTGSTVKI